MGGPGGRPPAAPRARQARACLASARAPLPRSAPARQPEEDLRERRICRAAGGAVWPARRVLQASRKKNSGLLCEDKHET
eukprot:scaffold1581_cov342-Prasinococcus_capsulatus_cf.AAC.14